MIARCPECRNFGQAPDEDAAEWRRTGPAPAQDAAEPRPAPRMPAYACRDHGHPVDHRGRGCPECRSH